MHFKIRSYLQIARPVNVIIGMISIFVGAFITGAIHPVEKVFFACLSGGLILAAGNVLNDYFDVEIDRVNKSFRPIPSKKLKMKEVRNFSIILFVLGIFLSIFIHALAILFAIITATGLIFYCAKFKRTVLLGNLAVSLFSAMAFLYGGIAVGLKLISFVPAVFAFFYHLGREIIKDVEDRSADASCLVQTLPVRYGQRVALLLATFVFGTLIILTFLPYIFGILGRGYFWIVLIGVDLVIISLLVFMWVKPSTDSLKKISAILKADMIVGIIAILFG